MFVIRREKCLLESRGKRLVSLDLRAKSDVLKEDINENNLNRPKRWKTGVVCKNAFENLFCIGKKDILTSKID